MTDAIPITRSRRGCEQCRRSKQKCDESRPCSRCLSRGLACSGPRTNFYIATDACSTQTPQSLVAASTKSAAEQRGSHRHESHTTNHAEQSHRQALTSGPAPSWTDVVTNSMTPHYLEQAKSMTLVRPWLSLVEGLRPAERPFLKYALASTSLLGLALGSGPEQASYLTNTASSCYGKALRSMNYQLSRGPTALTKDLLLSIMLVGSYEFRRGAGDQYHTHMDGLMRLLRLRHGNLACKCDGQRFFLVLRDRLLTTHIFRGVDLPMCEDQDHWFFYTPPDGTPWHRLQRIALKIPKLRRLSMGYAKPGPRLRPPELQLFEAESRQILESLQQWQVSSAPWMIPQGSGPHDPSFSMTKRWFHTLEIISLNALRLALDLRLSILGMSREKNNLVLERRNTIRAIRDSFEAICYSMARYTKIGDQVLEDGVPVPLAVMGSTGYLLQPLVLASMVDDVDSDLKQWLLARVYYLTGRTKLHMPPDTIRNWEKTVAALKFEDPKSLIAWDGRFSG